MNLKMKCKTLRFI